MVKLIEYELNGKHSKIRENLIQFWQLLTAPKANSLHLEECPKTNGESHDHVDNVIIQFRLNRL